MKSYNKELLDTPSVIFSIKRWIEKEENIEKILDNLFYNYYIVVTDEEIKNFISEKINKSESK